MGAEKKSFQDRRIRPLCHPSTPESIASGLRCVKGLQILSTQLLTTEDFTVPSSRSSVVALQLAENKNARNVYCSDRLFETKYEFAEQVQQLCGEQHKRTAFLA